jgi:hypothetical protein
MSEERQPGPWLQGLDSRRVHVGILCMGAKNLG